MSQCWQAGAWRAYLDGELPPEQMSRGREHLLHCASCAALHRELAARASRVGALLADLDLVPAPHLRAAPSRPRRKWAAAGLAAAAALAAAFVLALTRSPSVPARIAAVAVPEAAPATVEAPPMAPAAVERLPRIRPVRRRAPRYEYFLALDEEPIDTGTVMRVSLAGGVEADLIVDSEGRPRAIRAAR